MLPIPKVVEMDKEMKTNTINCKLLPGNAVEDSATIEELSIGFAILLQWTMKLVDHLHYQQSMKVTIILMALTIQQHNSSSSGETHLEIKLLKS